MSSDLDLRHLHRDFEPDPAFVERLGRQLERAASAESLPTAGREAEADGVALIDLETGPVQMTGRAGRRWIALAVAAAAAVVLATGLIRQHLEDADRTVVTDDSTLLERPGGMWPQEDLAEARAAQELVDEGSGQASWQVDALLHGDGWWEHLRAGRVQIAERFVRDQLGWERFAFNTHRGDDGDGAGDGVIRGIEFLRCAPGQTNPLYPLDDDRIRHVGDQSLCAPTIDEKRYEVVSFDLEQPARRGLTGIWVVTGWSRAPVFDQVDPIRAEAMATERLTTFLEARLSGAGAEPHVGISLPATAIPVLYATQSGARFERYEIERVAPFTWPDAATDFEVRLFADGGATIVAQRLQWRGGALHLASDATATTENGRPVPLRYAFFDDAVRLSAAAPWASSVFKAGLTFGDGGSAYLEVAEASAVLDAGCRRSTTATSARGLADAISSSSHLDASAPAAVSIGGRRGWSIDVTAPVGAVPCLDTDGFPILLPEEPSVRPLALRAGSRMRLMLIERGGNSNQPVLVIAVVAPVHTFEKVWDAASTVVGSIEITSGR